MGVKAKAAVITKIERKTSRENIGTNTNGTGSTNSNLHHQLLKQNKIA